MLPSTEIRVHLQVFAGEYDHGCNQGCFSRLHLPHISLTISVTLFYL